jgi:glycosyltransferase involved in cell wall biosynthesis
LRILFDHQIFTQQQYGGISRYYCALARQLGGYPDVWARIAAPVHFNEYLAEMNGALAFGWHPPRAAGARKLCRAISNLTFTTLAKRMRPQVIHETYYAARPAYRAPAQRVLTVFDMIHEKLPGDFSASDRTAQLKASAVQRADRIICISESTRRDLLETLKVPPERVAVTYLSYDTLQPLGQTAAALVGPAPFILHVGARKGYKNFAGLARAFAASSWLKNNFRIVCFGGRAFSGAEQGLLTNLGLTSTQVVQLSGGDDRLAALYKAAAAFVYPSRYEGFGIPPLEAMAQDCPVICSASSSIPEVVGDAGEYFNPDDIESIRNAMERVLQSTERRNELIALGRVRRTLFTWERCARETYDVYRTLAS